MRRPWTRMRRMSVSNDSLACPRCLPAAVTPDLPSSKQRGGFPRTNWTPARDESASKGSRGSYSSVSLVGFDGRVQGCVGNRYQNCTCCSVQ